jgi:hypothetical protein
MNQGLTLKIEEPLFLAREVNDALGELWSRLASLAPRYSLEIACHGLGIGVAKPRTEHDLQVLSTQLRV